MKIVFLEASSFGPIPLDELFTLGEMTMYAHSTTEEAMERVGDCEVLIVNKVRVTDELMARAPKLRLICEAATGVNNIDVEAAERRGIIVRNAVAYSTDSVVQLTFTHLLSLVCTAPYYDNFVKSGAYSRSSLFADTNHPFMELSGKTLGIIGMGNIGRKVASVATAFGMKVVYYSTSGTGHCRDYPCLSLEELLRVSDAVSIHAPLNERTEGLIGSEELRMMKPAAVLINMARGPIVNEAELAGAVDEGVIAGAALDAFTKEPLPEDSPLLHMKHPERMRYSPHVGWASTESLKRLVSIIADNIRKGW